MRRTSMMMLLVLGFKELARDATALETATATVAVVAVVAVAVAILVTVVVTVMTNMRQSTVMGTDPAMCPPVPLVALPYPLARVRRRRRARGGGRGGRQGRSWVS